MTVAIAVGVLVAAGIYLLLERGVVRPVLGLTLISHAVNLVLVASGGIDRRREPLLGQGIDPGQMADPLPHAFVLTAIVIFFGITIYLLTLTVAGPVGRVLAEENGDDSGSADAEWEGEPQVTGEAEDARTEHPAPGRWRLGDTEAE